MKSSAAPDATNSATSGEYLVSHCKSSVIHVSLGCRSARQPECNIGPTANSALLDSYPASDRQIEALGVTDWAISRRIVVLVRTPVILAGGLGPDNVADAIQAVRPAGVDSKTKTDRDGSHQKDLDRVRRFHKAARAADL